MRLLQPHTLWLGNAGDIRQPRPLHAAGIKAFIDLAIDELPSSISREAVHCRFPLLDGAGNPRWLLQAAIHTTVALIRNRTPTLIYCSAGMSRSPCIAAAAISTLTGQPIQACLNTVVAGAPADISGRLWESVQALMVQPPSF